jgi:hypothetical protein
MRRRHLNSIAVAVVVGLTLTACGTSSDPLGSVRAAARLTLLQSMEGTVVPHGGTVFPGGSSPIDARAALAFPAGLGYEALDVPAADRRPSGTAYLDFDPERLDVEPLERGALPAGRLWIALSFPRAGSSRASDATLALGLEALDPELLLTEIADGAVRASSVGERVIAHVPYTEYHVSVDLARVRATTCASVSTAICAAVTDEIAAVDHRSDLDAVTVEIVVWVDGQGRVIQLRASLPGSGWGSELVSLSNFGVTIPRSLPLASEVVDLTSLERAGTALSLASLLTGTPAADTG